MHTPVVVCAGALLQRDQKVSAVSHSTALVRMGRPTPDRSARVTLGSERISGAEPPTKGVDRMSKIRFVGLDVHADTIAVAVAEPDGEVRALGVMPNRLESIRKLVAKLGPVEHLRACYEAGPTGYIL